MKSFVVKLNELFLMDTGNVSVNFDKNKRRFRIPLYQREFKWTTDMITQLFNDIKNRNKFLGIVILDECDQDYEIVDGQQRITVFFLMLFCLYNRYSGSPLEQESLMRYIKTTGDTCTLINDSIGTYTNECGNKILIDISQDADVYYQKHTFDNAFSLLTQLMTSLEDNASIQDFKRKLFDCEILVLINNERLQSNPIEQVFLDINEKSKLLDVEDIFKGHCFENFSNEYHSLLRQKWVDLKKASFTFKQYRFEDLSQYLYLYLLFCRESHLQKKLTIKGTGKHILEGKTMDETNDILDELIEFGKVVNEFASRIQETNYRFEDISPNSHEYRFTTDHCILKDMSRGIIFEPEAQYQKLPLMFFIYALRRQENTRQTICHNDFCKIITNLYVYAALFVAIHGKKSKEDIERRLYEALVEAPTDISSAIDCVKGLRGELIDEFQFHGKMSISKLMPVFSIMDNFKTLKNWVEEVYTRDNGYTPEHFIIHDNRNSRVEWKLDSRKISFDIPKEMRGLRTRTINFLIMNKQLNELIGCFDIVTKIHIIREWYDTHQRSLPNHFQVYMSRIEAMPEYKQLKFLKQENCDDKQIILNAYISFIKAYFNDEAEGIFLQELTAAFRNVFRN